MSSYTEHSDTRLGSDAPGPPGFSAICSETSV